MKNLLLLLIFIINIAYAAVTAQLDRNPINLGESVSLIIKADNISNNTIDLGPLQRKFPILGSSSTTEVSIVNGKRIQHIQWIISFLPSKEGAHTIPALKVGNVVTEALTLTVKPALPAAQTKTPTHVNQAKAIPVFIEASMTPKIAYVNSQIYYTFKIFYAVNELKGQVIPPSLNNILFKVLGNDRQYQAHRDNQNYNVLERHYIFAAPSVGEFKIPGVRFEGIAPVIVNIAGGFPHISNNTVTLKAPEFILQVKPLPTGVSLASKKVHLTSQWDSTENWQIGQPITRTIKLQAQGVSGEQLPEFPKNIPSTVKSYAEPTVFSTELMTDSVWGMRIEKMSLIPQAVGELVFPPLQIAWLNTETGKIDYAELPAEQITIIGTNKIVNADESIDEKVSPILTSIAADKKRAYFLWALIFIIILIFVILVIRILAKKPSNFYKELAKACQSKEPKMIHAATLAWARSQWRASKIQSLGDILALDIILDLKSALEALSATLYKNNKNYFDAEKLLQAVNKQVQMKGRGEKKKPKSNELPPLYM